MADNNITKIRIKNKEKDYNIKDTGAIKGILYGNNTDGFEEAEADRQNEGYVKINVSKLVPATTHILGGVRIGNKDTTNIEIDDAAVIKAIVPIKTIKISGDKLVPNENCEVSLPLASDNPGLVKVSPYNTIKINNMGYVYTSFDGGKFTDIGEETENIDFEASVFNEVE